MKIIILIIVIISMILMIDAKYNSHHVVMENSFQHSKVPKGWIHTNKVFDKHQTLTLTFALRLENIEILEDLLNFEISNPKSINYRKYLNREQVNELTAPDVKKVKLFKDWLENEMNAIIVKELPDFIVASVPVLKASKVLDTHFELFEHHESGKQVIRTLGPYHMPAEFSDLVHFIGGTVRFPNTKKSNKHLDHQFITHQNNIHKLVQVGKVSSTTVNAPMVARLYAGDLSFGFLILPYCQDGSTSTTSQSICNGGIKSITMTALQTTYNFTPSQLQCASCNVFPNSVAQLSCLRSNQLLNLTASTVYCLSSEIQSNQFQNFVPIALNFSTTFTDGSQSSNFSTTTYLSPFLTPQYIQQLYQMPMLEGSYPDNVTAEASDFINQQSVAEFLGQYYSNQDLEQFLQMVGLDPRIAARVNVFGPNNQTNPGGEASLDIQWMLGLAPGFNTTFFSLGDLVNGQEPFLEWITDVVNNPQVIHTHSISYGDDEDSLSLDFMTRINYEFIKAGSIGITLVFSSGDVGANSNTEPIGDKFYPAFPASSPYVLAVGGTQLSTHTTPVCAARPSGGLLTVRCDTIGEITSSIATGSRITSGGGFSNVFSRPSYQDNVTVDYIATQLGHIPSSFYNKSSRSYPDVAALAHNFLVILGGEVIPVDGTSAAAPTFASVLSIINDRLLKDNRAPLGFVNPTIYTIGQQYPDAFFDIVMGDNSCAEVMPCNSVGYPAAPGYDAVTGFGSPNFEVLDRAIRHGYFKN